MQTTVVFEWSQPNPNFLQTLAQAVPPFIYRPSNYLKQFHKDFASAADLQGEIDYARVKSWAALHNKRDNMSKFDNPDLPTLQPWINATAGKKIRHQFVRNPYYHRIDSNGVQLALYRHRRDGDCRRWSGRRKIQRRRGRVAGARS